MNDLYQSTVAQMAEWVAAESRVCGSNNAKVPMKHASMSLKCHVTINNHKYSGTINQFLRWLATLNGIHSFEFLLLSWLVRLRGTA